MHEIDYNSPHYKRSRIAYTAQCALEYFIALLIADAFLAKLLSSIGISDSLIGIISSFVSLAFVIQILSLLLVKFRLKIKKTVIIFDAISQLFFCGIYFIPFLPFGKETKTVLVMLAIMVAYACNYLIASLRYQWANSYVEPTKRASFSATKEMISLISGIVFTTVVGMVIDKFESVGNLNGGFLLIAISMLFISISNVTCLMLIKKESADQEIVATGASFREVFNATIQNKSYRNVIVMSILWDCARYTSIGFLGIYKTKDLLISLFMIQVINTVASLIRIVVSRPFGWYSDKTSFAKGFGLAVMIAMISFLVSAFTTPSSWYLIIAQTILFQVSSAGTNANSFNITYSYVDARYFTQAMAIKNSISGICGFATSMLAGKLLGFIQANGNSLFGISVYGQQVLSAISFVLAAIVLLYCKTVIEKQTIRIQ